MNGQALSDFENQDTALIHATCVAVEGRAALIVGASGAGKTGLALKMMALGAVLVADDRVSLAMADGEVVADAAENLRGLIEARGIGLLRAKPAGPTPVSYVVDLDQIEPARLPNPITTVVLRQTVPLFRAGDVPNLAAALFQLMKMGRVDPEWPNT